MCLSGFVVLSGVKLSVPSAISEWGLIQKRKSCVYFVFSTPRPVIVEPLEQLDDEDGLPEKLAQKNPMYQK